MKTLLKSPSDYANFVNSLTLTKIFSDSDSSKEKIRKFNRALLERIEGKYMAEDGCNLPKSVARFRMSKDIEEIINRKIKEVDTVRGKIFCYYMGRFAAAPRSYKLWSKTNGGVDIDVISPTLGMLTEAWNYSPHLAIFISPEAGENYSSRHRELILEVAISSIAKFLEEEPC